MIKKMKKFFITATDTDAGKTYVAQAFVNALVGKQYKVAAYKPVSAGCQLIDSQLVNEDALLLAKQANCHQTISQINPIAFEKPIAPHIAAAEMNQEISISLLKAHYSEVVNIQPEIIVTEGAGGWRLPLGNGHYLSEFAQTTNQEVILVVNMKLGCLNHAVLTYQAIINDGLNCVGWIANCQQEMPYLDENISELQKLITAPLLAQLSLEPDISTASSRFDLTPLNL